MPVILDPKDYDRWLDPGVPGAEELLRPCPSADHRGGAALDAVTGLRRC